MALLPEIKKLVLAHDVLHKKIDGLRQGETVIRLSLPINTPRTAITQFLTDYKKRNPRISFVIFSDADHQDLLNGRVDAAYMPYRPPEDGLILWTINEFHNVPAASPDYVQKNGFPAEPEDMPDHDVILRAARHYPSSKHLCRNGETKEFSYRRLSFSGDVLSSIEALLNGEGVAMDLSFGVLKEYFAQNRIVPVLNGWHRENWDLCFAISQSQEDNTELRKFAREFCRFERKQSRSRSVEVLEFLAKAFPDSCGNPSGETARP